MGILNFITGPEATLLNNLAKGMGFGVGFLIIYIISSRLWSGIQLRDSNRIDTLIKLEGDRWEQKFNQESEERKRQHEFFKELLSNISAHTGELAGINAKLDNHSLEFERMTTQLGVLHGRIDQTLLNGHQRAVKEREAGPNKTTRGEL